MPKSRSLAHHINTDPAYHDLIKLVGYQGIKTPIREADYKRLIETYGRGRLEQASHALVDINCETLLATLKDEVRKHCIAIIGPAPEDWETFYEGIVNPPPNPHKQSPKEGQTEGEAPQDIDLVAEAVADAIREETNFDVEIKKPTETDELRSVHGRQLRHLLNAQHERFQRQPPGDPAHEEAICRMNQIEAEMKRRGNKVPPRPVWTEPYNPPPDPYPFDARTTVVAPGGLADVTTLTEKRLQELLDMNLRELESNDRDTITYQEALRDIKLIEAEHRRRELSDDLDDPVWPRNEKKCEKKSRKA